MTVPGQLLVGLADGGPLRSVDMEERYVLYPAIACDLVRLALQCNLMCQLGTTASLPKPKNNPEPYSYP